MPQYSVLHVFPLQTRIGGLGPKLVACEANCRFEVAHPAPRTWVVDADHATEDASLFPHSSFSEGNVRYTGRHPNEVFAVVTTGHDELTEQQSFLYRAEGSGAPFTPHALPDRGELIGVDETVFARPWPRCQEQCEPFKIYTEEALAAWRKTRPNDSSVPPPTAAMLFGHGGPMLVVDHQGMALWKDSRWTRVPVPWHTVLPGAAVRLTDGSSMVISRGPAKDGSQDGLYWVSKTGGDTALVDLVAASGAQRLRRVHFRNVVEREREIWIVADAEEGTVLLSPRDPAAVTRAPD